MLVSTTSYLNDVVRLRGCFERLDLVLERTVGLNWWRLGMRFSPLTRILRLLSREAASAARRAAECAAEARSLEEELVAQLEKPCAEDEPLERSLEALLVCLETMCDCASDLTCSPWWRLGTCLRAIVGRLGIKPWPFWRAEAEAKSVSDELRRWRSRRGRPPSSGKNAVEKAFPGEISLWDNSTFGKHLARIVEDPSSLTKLAIKHSHWAVASYAAQEAPSPEPLVSIIMPAYNRAHVMRESIQSVLEQTWSHWELLICDDGSDDDTHEVVTQFRDDRIRYLPLPHGGAARARNRGMQESRGAYIAYLDTDNIWHPAYLSVMIGALEQHMGKYVAYAKYIDVVMEPEGKYRVHRAEAIAFDYEALSEKNFIDFNSFVHRACLFRVLGGITESLPNHQDWDLALKYTHFQDPIYMDVFLTLYRRNTQWGQLIANKEAHLSARRVVQDNLKRYYEDGLPRPEPDTPKPKVSVVCWSADDAVRNRALRLSEGLTRSDRFEVQYVDYPGDVKESEHSASPEIETFVANSNPVIEGSVVYFVTEPSFEAPLMIGEPVDEQRFSSQIHASKACRAQLGFSVKDNVILSAGIPSGSDDLVRRLAGPYRILNIEEYPEEERIQLYAAADLLILGGDFSNSTRDPSAARLFAEASAMEVPSLVHPTAAFNGWAHQGYLETVEVSDSEMLQREIERLFRQPEVLREIGQRARRLFLRQFSYRSVRTHFELLHQRQLEQPGKLLVLEPSFELSWHSTDS